MIKYSLSNKPRNKDTYKACTKLKKNKPDTFCNEHTSDIILFESAKKYLKVHLGESETLAISKWKLEVANMKKRKIAFTIKY